MSEDLKKYQTELAHVKSENVKLDMKNFKLETENSKDADAEDALAAENANLRALVDQMKSMTMNGNSHKDTAVLEKKLEESLREKNRLESVAEEWTNLAQVCCFALGKRNS